MNCNITHKWTNDFDLLSDTEFDEFYNHALNCEFHSALLQQEEEAAMPYIKAALESGVWTSSQVKIVKPNIDILNWAKVSLLHLFNSISLLLKPRYFALGMSAIVAIFLIFGIYMLISNSKDIEEVTVPAILPEPTPELNLNNLNLGQNTDSKQLINKKRDQTQSTPDDKNMANENNEQAFSLSNSIIKPFVANKNTLSENLPIIKPQGRNPLDLIDFQPAFSNNSLISTNQTSLHVHGSRDRAFNFTLDGINIDESSAIGKNFSEQKVIELPTSARNTASLLTLQSGVTNEGVITSSISINNRNFVNLPALISKPSIVGVVREKNGKLISGATISIATAKIPLKVIRVVTSNKVGKFNIQTLKPNKYQVIIQSTDFKKWTGIILIKAGKQVKIEAQLVKK